MSSFMIFWYTPKLFACILLSYNKDTTRKALKSIRYVDNLFLHFLCILTNSISSTGHFTLKGLLFVYTNLIGCEYMNLQEFSPDRELSRPLFRQLAAFIEAHIANGSLPAGHKLPTERMVSELTGLSRGTVRQAFAYLEQQGLAYTKQGSGSFVAVQLRGKHSIAIVGSGQETLIDLKRQLNDLADMESTIFILESVTTAPDPARFLASYDLTLVPGSHYEKIASLIGDATDKLMEISVSPSEDTLRQIFALDREARIGIICRSNEFLATVKGTLVTYGFASDNISSFFEMDYTTSTYFPGGIDALISFSDAHIFTSERFQFRNEELIQKGGQIIPFVSHLEPSRLREIGNRLTGASPLSL